jgi:hypothetical protein
MPLPHETIAEAAEEITDEAQKLIDRFEALGFSNGRALDILGVAALVLLDTAPDAQVAFAAWWGRIERLCR